MKKNMQNALILDKPIVLGADDVAALLSIKKSRAYELIRDINHAKGHVLIKGRCYTKDFESFLEIDLDDYLKKSTKESSEKDNEKESDKYVNCKA